MNPLPFLVGELKRARLAAAILVLVVTVTVALGIVVMLAERGLRVGSARAADPFDLVVGAKGSATQLVLTTVYLKPALLDLVPGSVLVRLQADPGVAFAAPLALGDSYHGALIVGTSVDFVTDGGRHSLADGRAFRAMNEVVVGADVPLRLGDTFSPAHGVPVGSRQLEEADEHAHEGLHYVVVGRRPRLGSPWDRAILAPIEAVWAAHSLPTGHPPESPTIGPPWSPDSLPGVTAIVARPRSVADAYRLRGRYRAVDSMAVFPAEVLVELYQTLGDVRDLMTLLASATRVLVLASVALAVFAAVEGRRRSLAVLRALGASRGYVFAAVWLGMTALVAAGGALGLALGWVGATALARMLLERTGLVLPVGLSVAELGVLLPIVGGGALAAVAPAWLGYRQSVGAGLRS
jgi:putative ABC transport system permease protein